MIPLGSHRGFRSFLLPKYWLLTHTSFTWYLVDSFWKKACFQHWNSIRIQIWLSPYSCTSQRHVGFHSKRPRGYWIYLLANCQNFISRACFHSSEILPVKEPPSLFQHYASNRSQIRLSLRSGEWDFFRSLVILALVCGRPPYSIQHTSPIRVQIRLLPLFSVLMRIVCFPS